jgi:hypothetical protein
MGAHCTLDALGTHYVHVQVHTWEPHFYGKYTIARLFHKWGGYHSSHPCPPSLCYLYQPIRIFEFKILIPPKV